MNAFHTAELAKLQHTPRVSPREEIQDTFFPSCFHGAYAPVIDVRSGEVIGFQTSERFWTGRCRNPGTSQPLTSRLRRPSLSYYGRLGLKQQQILCAPDHGWVMLDLDVDSFFAADAEPHNAYLQLFRQYAWTEREIIVNIVGQPKNADLQAMADRLQQYGIEIALNAAGLHRGQFSLEALLDATIVQFDSSILDRAPGPAGFSAETLMQIARDVGIQTVMTGVDRPEHYDRARKMGVDGVQGRLFRQGGRRHQ